MNMQIILLTVSFGIPCPLPACYNRLGMESGEIPELNIKASGEYRSTTGEYRSHPATQARLNGPSYWEALSSVKEPWIQADIGYQTYVSGVVTQSIRSQWIEVPGEVDGGVWEPSINMIKVSTFSVSHDDAEVFIKDELGKDKVRSINFVFRTEA